MLSRRKDAGLFDHEQARRAIAQHQAARAPPLQPPTITRTTSPDPLFTKDDSTAMERRPSLSLGPLPPPPTVTSPSSPNVSPSVTPKMSPLASVVRRASLLRPGAARTKSTNDAPTPPPAPLVSPTLETLPAGRQWEAPLRSQSATPEVAATLAPPPARAPSIASSSGETPRPPNGRKKLVRRSLAPIVPSIRTDSDYLSAKSAHRSPSYSPHLVHSPSALSPAPPTSPTTQKRSWRRSFPLFSSAPSTPTLEDPAELRRKERSPSPVGDFPREVRREKALPPVDSRRKKRASTTSSGDSYLGDGEGGKPSSGGRKGSVASSSPSTSSGGGMWGAFKTGGGGKSKSIARSESDWEEELMSRSRSYEAGMEVLSRPTPMARSLSDPQVEVEKQRKALGGGGPASSSSLSLGKIEEQPEDPAVSRQPSLRRLIAQEEDAMSPATSSSSDPSSAGTRTRTQSSNTSPSLATTSRAPSPTRIISAKSSFSALARTITPEQSMHFSSPPPATRLTPTPLDCISTSTSPPSSVSDESIPSPSSAFPSTPELVRSRGAGAGAQKESSRHAFSGPSESDLSMLSGETTTSSTWDVSEGEEDDTQASSSAAEESECGKELAEGVRVHVEGEGVVGW